MSFEVAKRKMKEAQLRKKVQTKREEAHKEGRFSLFHVREFAKYFKNGVSYDSMEYMYELLEGWDKKCNLSYEFGTHLDELVSNEDYVVCINRGDFTFDKSNSGLEKSTRLESIMERGLINYGHANAVGGSAFMSGTIAGLSLATTPLIGLSGYINLVGSYKNNDTTIIMIFPSSLVGKDGNIKHGVDPNLVYDLSGENPVIRSEFMYGAILKKDNGYDEFYSKDQIIQSKNTRVSDSKGPKI